MIRQIEKAIDMIKQHFSKSIVFKNYSMEDEDSQKSTTAQKYNYLLNKHHVIQF